MNLIALKWLKTAYMLLFFFTFLMMPSYGIAGNDCDKLVKKICSDERFKFIKQVNRKSDSDFLILTDDLFGVRISSVEWNASECSRAKELARYSRETQTPFYDVGVQLTGADLTNICRISNESLEAIFRMIPNKRVK